MLKLTDSLPAEQKTLEALMKIITWRDKIGYFEYAIPQQLRLVLVPLSTAPCCNVHSKPVAASADSCPVQHVAQALSRRARVP
eukprot:2173896-Rhodomonas_salina.1